MNNIFEEVEKALLDKGYSFERKDLNRPWGGFWAIDRAQSSKFISEYFSDINSDDFDSKLEISPKVLLVAPQKRLSWQYHHRRSELWKIIQGPVGVGKSKTDAEKPLKMFNSNDLVKFDKGERHRLVGLDTVGLVAEIWIHTDENSPSDENDIVRLQDDFSRKTLNT